MSLPTSVPSPRPLPCASGLAWTHRVHGDEEGLAVAHGDSGEGISGRTDGKPVFLVWEKCCTWNRVMTPKADVWRLLLHRAVGNSSTRESRRGVISVTCSPGRPPWFCVVHGHPLGSGPPHPLLLSAHQGFLSVPEAPSGDPPRAHSPASRPLSEGRSPNPPVLFLSAFTDTVQTTSL